MTSWTGSSGGTLASPQVQPDPVGLAKQYGHYYATVATGGLWLLLKGIWDQSQANSDVCEKILAKGEEEKNAPRDETMTQARDVAAGPVPSAEGGSGPAEDGGPDADEGADKGTEARPDKDVDAGTSLDALDLP